MCPDKNSGNPLLSTNQVYLSKLDAQLFAQMHMAEARPKHGPGQLQLDAGKVWILWAPQFRVSNARGADVEPRTASWWFQIQGDAPVR